MVLLEEGKITKYDFNKQEDIDLIIKMIKELKSGEGFYLDLPNLMEANSTFDNVIIKLIHTAAALNNGTDAKIIQTNNDIFDPLETKFQFVVRRRY